MSLNKKKNQQIYNKIIKNLFLGKNLHIYIHIPFCASKCPYCAFGSITDKKYIDDYFEALCFEISQTLKIYKEKISTIFIGGGTPSLIESNFYKKIFEILNPNLGKFCEISIEANPNSVNLNWLQNIRNLGINRISFGVQSFDEKKLKMLGRIHSSNDAKMAILNAQKAGFKNINLDLIYETKFDNKNFLKKELSNIKNLPINHVSCYSLTLEENTPFHNKFEYKIENPNSSKFLFKTLQNLGFKQYEISNFGKICRHNYAYWQGKNYFGFGSFGVGFLSKKNLSEYLKFQNQELKNVDFARIYSPTNLQDYIKNPLFKNYEILSPKDIKFEKIFLGLRSKIGLSSKILNQNEIKKAKELVKSKKLILKNGIFYNTNYLLSDEISLFISQ